MDPCCVSLLAPCIGDIYRGMQGNGKENGSCHMMYGLGLSALNWGSMAPD